MAKQEGPSSHRRVVGVERDASVFRVGQEVEHDRWGRGVILDIGRSAVGLEATVNFPEAGGEKRLDLSLAPLKPL